MTDHTSTPLGTVRLATSADTARFGERLAAMLRPGDLVVLTGDLGAGKTTLTQGIGAGLGVRGQIASPTFIIARVHPSLADGPALVHVDAYRLASLDDVDALDLDASLDESVTVVEWGAGLVEQLAADRLELTIERPRGNATDTQPIHATEPGMAAEDAGSEPAEGDETRIITAVGYGKRWQNAHLPR